MALSENLQFKLKKRYQPSSVVDMKYKGNDVSFKTDEEGNAVVLFIGAQYERKNQGSTLYPEFKKR
jgi:hypothetical protein